MDKKKSRLSDRSRKKGSRSSKKKVGEDTVGSHGPPDFSPVQSPDQLSTISTEVQKTDKQTQPLVEKEKKQPQKEQSGQSRPDQRPRWSVEQFQVSPEPGKSRFHDLNLPNDVMHGIADLNFRYCTPIQEKALPELLAGKDIVGRASTGTGKSAVFLIALLSRLLKKRKEKPKNGSPRALILAPTRELVMQIAKDGKELAKYLPLHIMAVYGGTDYQKQQNELRNRRVDVLVATPGRLLDYLRNRVVRLDFVETLVLDEADRMLDMGFIPDVRRIVSKTPPKDQRQTMLFSATMTDEVKHLAAQWSRQADHVETEAEQVAVDTVEQIVYMTTAKEKYDVLYNLITKKDHQRIIIFTNMKNEARRLANRLQRNNISCVLLTGDVPQKKRMARLDSFREGRVNVMVATDVAGRGIHIDGISHVVNYTLPYEPEDYVHRIGRTGRAGESGISISFADEDGGFYLPDIEEFIGSSLPCAVPDEDLLTPAPKGSEKPRRNERPKGRKRKWRSR